MLLKKFPMFSLAVLFAMTAQPVFADDDEKDEKKQPCPVASPYVDGFGNTVSYDEKFGPGTTAIMSCIKEREDIKLVMQVNNFVDGKGRPYGFRNLPKMLDDYLITHGVDEDEIDIRVVIHGGGHPFVLDPDAPNAHPLASKNTFKGMVMGLMARGVKVQFCLNTAAALNVKTHQIIPGVEYVTAGLTSIADYQERGYNYIQP